MAPWDELMRYEAKISVGCLKLMSKALYSTVEKPFAGCRKSTAQLAARSLIFRRQRPGSVPPDETASTPLSRGRSTQLDLGSHKKLAPKGYASTRLARVSSILKCTIQSV